MLDNKLIESALALTGKTMEDVSDEDTSNRLWFRIDIFCYYLLDRQFLIKYYQNQKPWYMPSIETTDLMAGEFWYAIMEYQSWNEKPLIELLSKIWKSNT